MIDIDKYEGHTEGPWNLTPEGHIVADDMTVVCNKHTKRIVETNHKDIQLMADAPLLLAEVKRLRGVIARVWDLMQNSNHGEREMLFWGINNENTGWMKVHEELAMKELNWGEEE